jgi:hypothetical protein
MYPTAEYYKGHSRVIPDEVHHLEFLLIQKMSF